MVSRQIFQVTGVVAWDDKLPPISPWQCIWRQTVLAHMFPYIGDYRKNMWPMENTDHDPMATTLSSHSALAQTLLGFLLCTLYILAHHALGVSAAVCAWPAALSPFMGCCHRLFVFPCIHEVISRCLLLQRLWLSLTALLTAAKSKKKIKSGLPKESCSDI